MKFFTIFKQSLKAIMNNKGRSFLTVLGIIIGISSVIALISLGNGVQAQISKQINKLGTTTLTVMPGASELGAANRSGSSSSSNRSGAGLSAGLSTSVSTLTVTDLKNLQNKSTNPDIANVNGIISGSTLLTVKGNDTRYNVLGVDTTQFTINNQTVANGRLFDATDVTSGNRVIVLGSQVASDVYGSVNPVGKDIMIEKDSYLVVGVLSESNESSLGNPNNGIYIPYTSAMKTFGSDNFSSLKIVSTNENTVDKAKTEATNTLLSDHGITDKNKADFTILSAKDLLSAITSITGVLTSLLAGIAAISLVVGGIGIMNIMLVSVTERTREIGLRKAVGAKTIDILLQFIVEAVVLTLAGGILGIGLGMLIGDVLARFVNFQPIVTLGAIFLAVGVSSAVGLVFGIYPAAKAARLNPIDALRYE
jgi:putative ABC transport system permease protein